METVSKTLSTMVTSAREDLQILKDTGPSIQMKNGRSKMHAALVYRIERKLSLHVLLTLLSEIKIS
jgi:hypothetical protein